MVLKIAECINSTKKLPVNIVQTGPDILSGQVTAGVRNYFNVELIAATGEWICRCKKSGERGFPCDHGLALMTTLRSDRNLFDNKWDILNCLWTSEVFSTETWKNQYTNNAFLPDGNFSEIPECHLDPWERPPKTGGRKRSNRLGLE